MRILTMILAVMTAAAMALPVRALEQEYTMFNTSVKLVTDSGSVSLEGTNEVIDRTSHARTYVLTDPQNESLQVSYLIDVNNQAPPFVSIAAPESTVYEFCLPEREAVPEEGMNLSFANEVRLYFSMSDFSAVQAWRESAGCDRFLEPARALLRGVLSADQGDADFQVKAQTFTDLVIVFGHQVLPSDAGPDLFGDADTQKSLSGFHLVIDAPKLLHGTGDQHTEGTGGSEGCVGDPPPCTYDMNTICWSDARVCSLNCCRSCCAYQSSILGAGCGFVCACCGLFPNGLCCPVCGACMGASAVDYLLCIGNCWAQDWAYMNGHGGTWGTEWPTGGEQ